MIILSNFSPQIEDFFLFLKNFYYQKFLKSLFLSLSLSTCHLINKSFSNHKKILFFFRSSLYLLLNSVELQKANLSQEQSGAGSTNGSPPSSASTTPTPAGTTNTAGSPSATNNVTDAAAQSALASAIPLAQLLSKPGALNALTSLSALGGLTDLLGNLSSLGPPVQTTGVHRAKTINSRPRPVSSNPNSLNGNDVNKMRSERSKFNPY